MNNFFLWWVLSAITGSPLLALLIVIALWFFLDRFTLGVLPDPFRIFSRLRRQWHWERVLRVNSHDRQARYQLAETLLERGKPAQAMQMLKPNLEAGDDDKNTLFVMARKKLSPAYTEWERNQWQSFALEQLFGEEDEVTYSLDDAQEVFRR